MQFSEISSQEMQRMKDRVKPVIDKHAEGLPADLRALFFDEVAKARPAR